VDYDDFMKKYRMPAKSIVPLWQVSKFFDGVGVLLRRKLVDIGLVDELFHTEATLLWEKVKPLAEGRRKELNQPTVYQCFEYLYNEMKKREQKLHPAAQYVWDKALPQTELLHALTPEKGYHYQSSIQDSDNSRKQEQ